MFVKREVGFRCSLAVNGHGAFSTIMAGIANKLGGLGQAAVRRVCSASLMLSLVLLQLLYRPMSSPCVTGAHATPSQPPAMNEPGAWASSGAKEPAALVSGRPWECYVLNVKR